MKPSEYASEHNNPTYWAKVKILATELGSDCCTGVPDIDPNACYEHDIAYRTHCNALGDPITRDWADALLYQRHVQAGIPTIGIIYWAGVRTLGRQAWDNTLFFDFDSVERPQEAP